MRLEGTSGNKSPYIITISKLKLFLDVGAGMQSWFPTSSPSSKISLDNLNIASCMEHLLAHFGNAVEMNDVTLTQHIRGCPQQHRAAGR
jgi:hypothetical protein